MPRNNSLPGKDQELNELIANYEEMQTAGKSIYLDGDQLADIADFYAMERRLQEAQEVVTYGLHLHPGNTDLLIEQAYLHLDNKEIQKAVDVALSIAEEHATEVKFLNAEILLNQEKFEEAESLLNTIEERDELDIIIEIAYLYINTGYPNKALPWLAPNLEQYKEDENFIAVLADCLSAVEQFEKAEYYYNTLSDKAPFHAPSWMGLARCYYNNKEYPKAIESLDFALAADEHLGEAYLMKAHSLIHLENEFEAIAAYEKALQYSAISSHFAHMFMGLAYSNKEEWEKADIHFNSALTEMNINKAKEEVDPVLMVDLYCNQAICLSKQGHYEAALHLCEIAKDDYPGNPEPYLTQGRIYMTHEEVDKAYEQWGLATQYAPDAETWYQIGTFNMELGRAEDARTYFEEAAKRNPEIEGVYEELAAACLYLQDLTAFHKYNMLSKDPVDFSGLNKRLKEIGTDDLVEELRVFLKLINDPNDEQKEDN